MTATIQKTCAGQVDDISLYHFLYGRCCTRQDYRPSTARRNSLRFFDLLVLGMDTYFLHENYVLQGPLY